MFIYLFDAARATPAPCPRCRDCGGPAHPATGCQYAPDYIVCGPCAREAWAWYVRFVNSKGGRSGVWFYEHAASGRGKEGA